MDAIIDALVEEWQTILKILGVIAIIVVLVVWAWGYVFPAPPAAPAEDFPAYIEPINGSGAMATNATATPAPSPEPEYANWPGVRIERDMAYMDVNEYYSTGGFDLMITEKQYNSGPYMPIYATISDGNRSYEWLENQGAFDPQRGIVVSCIVDHPLEDQIQMFNAHRLI